MMAAEQLSLWGKTVVVSTPLFWGCAILAPEVLK